MTCFDGINGVKEGQVDEVDSSGRVTEKTKKEYVRLGDTNSAKMLFRSIFFLIYQYNLINSGGVTLLVLCSKSVSLWSYDSL